MLHVDHLEMYADHVARQRLAEAAQERRARQVRRSDARQATGLRALLRAAGQMLTVDRALDEARADAHL